MPRVSANVKRVHPSMTIMRLGNSLVLINNENETYKFIVEDLDHIIMFEGADMLACCCGTLLSKRCSPSIQHFYELLSHDSNIVVNDLGQFKLLGKGPLNRIKSISSTQRLFSRKNHIEVINTDGELETTIQATMLNSKGVLPLCQDNETQEYLAIDNTAGIRLIPCNMNFEGLIKVVRLQGCAVGNLCVFPERLILMDFFSNNEMMYRTINIALDPRLIRRLTCAFTTGDEWLYFTSNFKVYGIEPTTNTVLQSSSISSIGNVLSVDGKLLRIMRDSLVPFRISRLKGIEVSICTSTIFDCDHCYTPYVTIDEKYTLFLDLWSENPGIIYCKVGGKTHTNYINGRLLVHSLNDENNSFTVSGSSEHVIKNVFEDELETFWYCDGNALLVQTKHNILFKSNTMSDAIVLVEDSSSRTSYWVGDIIWVVFSCAIYVFILNPITRAVEKSHVHRLQPGAGARVTVNPMNGSTAVLTYYGKRYVIIVSEDGVQSLDIPDSEHSQMFSNPVFLGSNFFCIDNCSVYCINNGNISEWDCVVPFNLYNTRTNIIVTPFSGVLVKLNLILDSDMCLKAEIARYNDESNGYTLEEKNFSLLDMFDNFTLL
ncbi:hypothetical protein PCE1_002667 [Barthelona sp. PCE]